MIRFAIRNEAGLWRSSRWSEKFAGWDEAQLWESQKTAQKEVKRWLANWEWDCPDWPDRSTCTKVSKPVVCTVVPISIGEPNA